VFLLVRSKPEDKGLQALGADEMTSAGTTSDAGLTGLPLRELRKHPTFWVYVTGIFVMLLTMGAMYHMPAHITGIGISAELSATFVSIYSLIAIFGKLLMGAVFDRFGVKAGILLG